MRDNLKLRIQELEAVLLMFKHPGDDNCFCDWYVHSANHDEKCKEARAVLALVDKNQPIAK